MTGKKQKKACLNKALNFLTIHLTEQHSHIHTATQPVANVDQPTSTVRLTRAQTMMMNGSDGYQSQLRRKEGRKSRSDGTVDPNPNKMYAGEHTKSDVNVNGSFDFLNLQKSAPSSTTFSRRKMSSSMRHCNKLLGKPNTFFNSTRPSSHRMKS